MSALGTREMMESLLREAPEVLCAYGLSSEGFERSDEGLLGEGGKADDGVRPAVRGAMWVARASALASWLRGWTFPSRRPAPVAAWSSWNLLEGPFDPSRSAQAMAEGRSRAPVVGQRRREPSLEERFASLAAKEALAQLRAVRDAFGWEGDADVERTLSGFPKDASGLSGTASTLAGLLAAEVRGGTARKGALAAARLWMGRPWEDAGFAPALQGACARLLSGDKACDKLYELWCLAAVEAACARAGAGFSAARSRLVGSGRGPWASSPSGASLWFQSRAPLAPSSLSVSFEGGPEKPVERIPDMILSQGGRSLPFDAKNRDFSSRGSDVAVEMLGEGDAYGLVRSVCLWPSSVPSLAEYRLGGRSVAVVGLPPADLDVPGPLDAAISAFLSAAEDSGK